jgi:hypothetical protein
MNQNNYMTYMVTYVTSQTNNLHTPKKTLQTPESAITRHFGHAVKFM